MRDIEQYEFEEIAKILEMNETAIRVALSRARKQLKKICQTTVMELNKIEMLLEKYFEGQTSIHEEKELQILYLCRCCVLIWNSTPQFLGIFQRLLHWS
jgi:hypothetical protein